MPKLPKTPKAFTREQQMAMKGATRALIEQWSREMAQTIDADLPTGVGFCLIMFRFDGAFATYCSNAEREGMVKHLEEMLAHLKAGRIMPPVDAPPGVETP
jgi:hypothetical protein